MKKWRKTKDKKGFTLVELIVVLVILAILIALLVPALTGYIDKAKDKKVHAELNLIVKAAVASYDEVVVKYPLEGSAQILYSKGFVSKEEWDKEFIKQLKMLLGSDIDINDILNIMIICGSDSNKIQVMYINYSANGKTYYYTNEDGEISITNS